MSKLVGVNSFVTRQTAESKFSHFSGSWDEVVSLVEANFADAKPGRRDGIMNVTVPADKFFSGVIIVTAETELKAAFGTRRPDEDPYIDVVATGGEKLPAKMVEVVLYRHDVLAEKNEHSTDADWEIISLNARPTEEPEPMTPMAMARNFLELTGGTKADYTAEEFARAIVYWSRRAMRG